MVTAEAMLGEKPKDEVAAWAAWCSARSGAFSLKICTAPDREVRGFVLKAEARVKRDQQYEKLQAALSSGNRAEADRLVQGASKQAMVDLLALAVDGRAPEILAFLMSAGADPYLPSTQGTAPLSSAAFLGLPTFVLAMLDGKPLALDRHSRRGITPLMMAAFYGHEEVVRILLKAGADPDEICKRPESSLIKVHGGVLRILRDAGGHLPKGILELLDKGVALGD